MPRKRSKRLRAIGIAIGTILAIGIVSFLRQPSRRQWIDPTFEDTRTPPLVMQGGDPYIRAFMRTISTSEANDRQPYSIIYGGSHADNLDRHPERCITIVNGPNQGNCSTAAGRYQMINITWYKMAKRYHPEPECVLFVFDCKYSFQPEYQDRVLYAWLSDERMWKMNIPQLLKDGELEKVRKRLSSTWTSLGYGIENNSMTSKLADAYQDLLEEELSQQQK